MRHLTQGLSLFQKQLPCGQEWRDTPSNCTPCCYHLSSATWHSHASAPLLTTGSSQTIVWQLQTNLLTAHLPISTAHLPTSTPLPTQVIKPCHQHIPARIPCHARSYGCRQCTKQAHMADCTGSTCARQAAMAQFLPGPARGSACHMYSHLRKQGHGCRPMPAGLRHSFHSREVGHKTPFLRGRLPTPCLLGTPLKLLLVLALCLPTHHLVGPAQLLWGSPACALVWEPCMCAPWWQQHKRGNHRVACACMAHNTTRKLDADQRLDTLLPLLLQSSRHTLCTATSYVKAGSSWGQAATYMGFVNVTRQNIADRQGQCQHINTAACKPSAEHQAQITYKNTFETSIRQLLQHEDTRMST